MHDLEVARCSLRLLLARKQTRKPSHLSYLERT